MQLGSDEKPTTKKRRILSLSLAAASLVAAATSAPGSVIFNPIEKARTAVEISGANTQRNLPGPLVLKSANSMHQLAMQHDSHSSHSSHSSHASHSSHSSHSSGL
jgi:hypothetical protein